MNIYCRDIQHAQITRILGNTYVQVHCSGVQIIKFSAFQPQIRTDSDSDVSDFLMSKPRKCPGGGTEEIPFSLNATHYLMCSLLPSYLMTHSQKEIGATMPDSVSYKTSTAENVFICFLIWNHRPVAKAKSLLDVIVFIFIPKFSFDLR